MAPVLEIDSLLESPLSDLHALAGELDIEGYRLLRKADLAEVCATTTALAEVTIQWALGWLEPRLEADLGTPLSEKGERQQAYHHPRVGF